MLDNRQGRSMSVYSSRLNGVHHGLNRKFGVRPHRRQQRRCSVSHKLLYQAVSKVTAVPGISRVIQQSVWNIVCGHIQRANPGNTAVVMYSTIFGDIAPCKPLKVYRRFGGPSTPSWSKNKPLKKQISCHLLRFLLGLSFDPEDGDDMFLRNVG
jgi:hypothetical protein